MRDYRINYGNGQVSSSFFSSRKEAVRRLRQEQKASIPEGSGGGFWLELYDTGSADCPGDWFPTKLSDADKEGS